MAEILVLYSTVDGHTRRICERIAQRIEGHGHRVTLQSIDREPPPDPADFERVVIGASIHYGRHHPSVRRFIDRHAQALQQRASALFSVNLVARKPGRDTLESNPYLKKLLRQVSWQPDLVAVFAGKLDYSLYGFVDRQIIRLIMWITKGPTNLDASIEFTDWDNVDAFAERIAAARMD